MIGLRIKQGHSYDQHSFWANDLSEEKDIWVSFIETIEKIESPHLVHYGSYESIFFKRMKERYGQTVVSSANIDCLTKESVNMLSVIYGQFYFPTYSNGLKEIAQYLGFRWTDSEASGLNALSIRSKWEALKADSLKERLITYNAEDCEALERVTQTIVQLCQRRQDTSSANSEVVHTDSLKRDFPQRFGANDFKMPEFGYINQCAYWHYQRDKVYVRSSHQLKRKSKKVRQRYKPFSINTTVECPADTCCPKCKGQEIRKYGKKSRIVHDLKFSRTGIKRWIVKYSFGRYRCCHCDISFVSQHRPVAKRVGWQLLAYAMYQIIELRISQRTVANSLNQLFGFHMEGSEIHRQKARAAQYYKKTYKAILNRIRKGKLIHADETKFRIQGKEVFVWVLTNLEEVAYFYTTTREGDLLRALLWDFKGVLVSDFYTVYDSIDCPQQKCLIHLIRDLNDDVLKQPFDEEVKEIAQEFATLVKPMIETVDQYGLKARFLRKHKTFVERFYRKFLKNDYKSEVAIKWKKRFNKNRNTLFTFLDHDGIPWNNNNAEYAIKAFARLRRVIGGTSTDRGIDEYLYLLSICETCKYQEINFLDFLRSGETNIEKFMKSKAFRRY